MAKKLKKLEELKLRQAIRTMIEQELDQFDIEDEEEDKCDIGECGVECEACEKNETCDKYKKNEDEELEEVSTTGDVAGYQTPYAFAGKDKEKQKQNAEQLGYKLVNEPEDRDWKDLEDARKEPLVWRKKFGEMKKRSGLSENKWRDKIMKKLKTVNNPNLRAFYEGLIEENINEVSQGDNQDFGNFSDKKAFAGGGDKLEEGRRGAYQNYRDDENLTTRQKIGESLRNVRNQLQEIEKTIDLNLRLKQETGINTQQYWKNTHRALNKINEKMTRIINKVRRF